MGLGLVFLNRTAMLVGFPVNSNTIQTAVLGTSATSASAGSFKTGADGVVEVPLAITNTQYQPAALNIPADKPVRIVVTRNEDVACSDQIAFPQLGIKQDLKANGVTTVNLPATKGGTYTMTCGMGMMSGQLIVGAAASGSGAGTVGGPSAGFWLLFALVAAAGGLYVARGLFPRYVAAAQSEHSPASNTRKSAAQAKATTAGAGSRHGNHKSARRGRS
jgi:hypothetical protein